MATMENKPFDVPILFMIFNRPEPTKVVFEEIRKLRPTKLFVAADGPRTDRPDDIKKCKEARAIATAVDWPCEIKTLFRDSNKGCKYGPSENVTWFFENVEEGIILEDDCVPHPSFFPFCQELLERYRHENIMHISGNNFQKGNKRLSIKESYYFSILPHIWGWASWRRAWQKYDLQMKSWPEVRNKKTLRNVLRSPAVYEYWQKVWDAYYDGSHQSWDGQWTYACMLNKGLAVTPVNLVTNIGFNEEATHTKNRDSQFSRISSESIQFPLRHPTEIRANRLADDFTFSNNFTADRNFRQKIVGPFRRTFPGIYQKLKDLFRRS
jgi:hypothetical protein